MENMVRGLHLDHNIKANGPKSIPRGWPLPNTNECDVFHEVEKTLIWTSNFLELALLSKLLTSLLFYFRYMQV